ncbi:hypothetical protein HPB48_022594 [Haemaphysalis longicornis]|uniref:Uncharacterized protein n=1 Tax=Haemaphysalis longicornis TaxID=44386 RepID=A0A9J6GM23_HAELO|nr:hypothetical protein HPB48_022594 [Haemaphysalis longicornis]
MLANILPHFYVAHESPVTLHLTLQPPNKSLLFLQVWETYDLRWNSTFSPIRKLRWWFCKELVARSLLFLGRLFVKLRCLGLVLPRIIIPSRANNTEQWGQTAKGGLTGSVSWAARCACAMPTDGLSVRVICNRSRGPSTLLESFAAALGHPTAGGYAVATVKNIGIGRALMGGGVSSLLCFIVPSFKGTRDAAKEDLKNLFTWLLHYNDYCLNAKSTYNSITKKTGPLQTFLRDTTSYTVQCCLQDSPGFNVGDFLAVLAATVPESVQETVVHRVDVELAGTYTRGQLVHAWQPKDLPYVRTQQNHCETLQYPPSSDILQASFRPPRRG